MIFGPPKSGKTIFCENLGMSIAAGIKQYLGQRIISSNNVVMFISFEEHYTGRTERNSLQANILSIPYGNDWLEKYIVVDEGMPRYITTEPQWKELADLINSIKPSVVFLDSLTRMYTGIIEDSSVAKQLTKNLRSLSEATGTTVIVIHHTHKMYGQPLSIDTIAGSRVIAQEMDFMIGINQTFDGRKYLKNVAFRHIACDSETINTFNITDSCWIEVTGKTEEMKLLSALDGRKDDVNRNRIVDHLIEQKELGMTMTVTADLERKFVPHTMSRQTLFSSLNKLTSDGIITRHDRGKYSIAA